MNASFATVTAVVFAALSAAPSSAAVLGSRLWVAPAAPVIVKADFVQGHESVAGVAARTPAARAEASSMMAQRYFDADIIITLGALALASGGFVAAGIAGSRRRSAVASVVSPREGWREEVMQALETDLAQFTTGLRRAA
jgi:hypothetical protein